LPEELRMKKCEAFTNTDKKNKNKVRTKEQEEKK